jgi:hypothetical protein
MKLSTSAIRNSFFILAVILALTGLSASAQTTAQIAGSIQAQAPSVPRITQAIDETQLVTLKGNIHPLARKEFDQGAVSDSMPATRMLLLLQRSAQQEAALRQLLEDQQNKGAANFHKWLTPAQYGTQFGPADADIQTVTQWLASQGFQGIKVGTGRTTIEFSGNVAQVRNAFHTEIHKFVVNGEERHANASDPQIPAALTPVVAGVAGLHNFPPKAHVHKMGTFRRDKTTGQVKPLFTFPVGGGDIFALGPTDFATIYNVAPLWTAGTDGTGQTIAVVGDSNIVMSDITDFRTMFGLPTTNSFNTPQVIVNGPDPGLNGDETEADLDVQWSGAVAKNAQIILVVTEQPQTIGVAGVDLSALYIIDNNLAPVMSESFGSCERGANNQLESFLWEEASALGITAMVSAGDSGSAGCDPSTNPLVATQGLAVSGNASTPFNVAVGGTDFNSSLANYGATYWNTTNTAVTESSAKSYIPEITWNDTCASGGSTTACTSTVINNDANNFQPGIDVVAGSGGSSAVYTGAQKPSWQTGFGDANRDLPDVSLFAANGFNFSFYIICEQDANAAQGGSSSSCDLNSPFLDFQGVGGTSASSPTFAAIMALVNQKKGRQGNANYVLYPMSKKTGATCTSNATTAASPGSCVFYDLPAGSGNISVACQGGTTDCSNTNSSLFGIITTTTGGTTPAYNTAAGYDLATGLGSVNAANLVNGWTNPSFTPSTTTFSLNGGTAVAITHGTAISVSGKVTGTGGTPTGIVSLMQGTDAGTVIDTFSLSGGSYSGTTTMLPGTTTGYQVIAHYGGDGTFAASDSPAQTVSSVTKENSAVVVSFVTSANVITTAAQSVPYGSPYLLRVDVTNSAMQQCSVTTTLPCPTGTITLLDNLNPLNDFLVPGTTTPTNVASLTNLGFLEDQPVQLNGGNHSITAKYSGDNSFNAQPTSNALSVMITATATAATLFASPTSVNTGQNVTLTATVGSQSNSVLGPTGTVTFSTCGTPPCTAAVVPTGANANTGIGAFGTATLVTSFSTAGAKSITATYGGDTNYAPSPASGAVTVTVTQAQVGSFTLGGTTATVTAGASGNSAITLTPTGGFTGAVAITCGTTLPGVTCSALNVTVPSGGANGTGSLVVNVAAPSSGTTAMSLPGTQNLWAATKPARVGAVGWWTLSGGTGFAAILFLFLPGRKQYRAALGLGLLCVLSFALGCGGGSGGGGGGGGGGTTATTTHLTVSSTKVAATGTLTVSATVTGGTPTGNVQFFVDGAAAGGTVPVAGGTTGNIMLTAASAPPLFQLIGTHTISAHYLGDATTGASSSGTLNIAVTGTTQLPISANPASSNANVTISLTIN